MAFFRACESVRPLRERLFSDPFAAHFVRPRLRAAVWLSRVPLLAVLVRRYTDGRLPGARTSALARTRWIDDALCQALGEDVRQIVILGAGFDCRAYRLSGLGSTSIFEVDQPAMLAYKLARLRQVLPQLPQNVRFVPIDFNRGNLAQRLAETGFDPSLRAGFLWEGVTHYLSSEAVDSVLRYVSTCSPGSWLVFTYVHSGGLDGSVRFEAAAGIVEHVANLGEPWTFGLDPPSVPEFLRMRGLRLDRDASAREYRAQFYGTDDERMRGYDFYHVAIAHVPAGEEETATAQEENGDFRRMACLKSAHPTKLPGTAKF
jgi:methyltransferase (TIGR00027 family)